MQSWPKENSAASVRQFWCALVLMACWFPSLAAAQEPAVRRALLIGVSDYLANDEVAAAGAVLLPDLQGPANDVLLMERVLATRFGFHPENIRILTDREATRAALISALEQLVLEAGPDDVVYVHFSGHGSRQQDRGGDKADGWDRTLLPYDARTAGVADIRDDEIVSVLDRLPARDVLVVLDTGSTPMLTAAGSDVRVRGVGPDPRSALYEEGPMPGGPAGQTSYAILSAAVPEQYALEGRLSDGRWFGWFSRSLARALSSGDGDATTELLHRRVQREMNNLGDAEGLRAPTSGITGTTAGLERAPLAADRLPTGEPGLANRVWSAVDPLGDGRIDLAHGRFLGAEPGSLWAVYPPDTEAFSGDNILATAEVVSTEGGVARALLDGGGTVPGGSRAVLVAPAPPPETIGVWLNRVAADDRARLSEALAASRRVRFVESGRGARFIINVDQRGCRVLGPGGLQLADAFQHRGIEPTAARLATLFERAARVRHLQALSNPGGTLRVEIDVNPIDVDGMPRSRPVPGFRDIPAFRVRQRDEPRAPDNSLIMAIRASQPAYVTVVDIGPEGSITTLFPNPVSDERGFYPDGAILAGREVRIPDSLTAGSAGFFIDYEPPLGPDMLRVFAAGDPLTAERIRVYLARYAVWADGDGAKPDFQDIFLPLEMPSMEGVGTAETGFGVPIGQGVREETVFGTWSASSASFLIVE